MSHLVRGETEIKDREVLDRALAKLGWERSHYEASYKIAWDGTIVHDCVTIQIPGWQRRIAFDLKGGEFFDNYSPYSNKTHPEVLAGRKIVGEDGQWGDIKKLELLKSVYNATVCLDVAARLGQSYREEIQEDQVVLHRYT